MKALRDRSMFRLLERLALRTWPAQLEQPCEGWILRASDGVTKRANSAWTIDDIEQWTENEKAIAESEAFYRSHRLTPRFHISEASPSGLDEYLERRGYVKETPCLMMTTDVGQAIRRTEPVYGNSLRAVVQPSHDASWLGHFLALEGFAPELLEFYDNLFSRIEAPTVYISIMDRDQCVGMGTAVAEDGWSGFINIVVHPQLRGQGIGKRIVHELARWSQDQGADRLYLQVIADNAPAIRLYSGAGYEKLFAYHYRTKPMDNL
ncbi:GNAT family N-acetyltransferase [Paenibacillus elgii]